MSQEQVEVKVGQRWRVNRVLDAGMDNRHCPIGCEIFIAKEYNDVSVEFRDPQGKGWLITHNRLRDRCSLLPDSPPATEAACDCDSITVVNVTIGPPLPGAGKYICTLNTVEFDNPESKPKPFDGPDMTPMDLSRLEKLPDDIERMARKQIVNGTRLELGGVMQTKGSE